MNMMMHKKAAVEVLESNGNLSKILTHDGDEFWVKTSDLKPPTAPKIPRSLRVAKFHPELQPFIDYLGTPEACTSLDLEARDASMDAAIRQQYRSLSGEELVEGAGYRIAPESARKQGSEGSVRFVPPVEYPAAVLDLLSPDGTGHINHIDFVWMLVEQGFRVTR